MRPFLRRFLKLSTALSFLILNPRRGFIKLLEEQQNHLTSPHNFLRRISLEQLHKGDLPEVKFVSFLGGGSSPTDYLLLLIIAKQFKKFSYLEIGTWRGESIRNILESPNCEKAVSVTLDPLKWGGANESIVQASNSLIDYSDIRLFQIYEDSSILDFSNLGKYDIVFIDGDHSYEAILSDTKNALSILKDDSSVIVWHDYSSDNDQSVIYSTLNAIMDAVPYELHKYLYYVENTMSAVFMKREVVSLGPNSKNHVSMPSRFFSLNFRIISIDK